MIDINEIDNFLEENEDRAVMELFKEVPEEFVTKTLKVFKEYFIVFQTEREITESMRGVRVYPPGNLYQKQNNVLLFHGEDTSPKDIASRLNNVIENRIVALEMKDFQAQISNTVGVLNKIPIILFDDKKIKNQFLGYKSLAYLKAFKDHFIFYYLNENPEPFKKQFNLTKFPSLLAFLKTTNDQGVEQIGGAPFSGSLNFRNMVQFLMQIISHEKRDFQGEDNKDEGGETFSQDKTINEFENYSVIERNCQNKLCILAFDRPFFNFNQKVEIDLEVLKEVQGFYNKKSLEIFVIDGGCYHDKLYNLNLNWGKLPWLVVYNGKDKSIYPLQERFNVKGIRTNLIKIKKGILKPIGSINNLNFEKRDCLSENQKYKDRIDELNKTTTDDQILLETIAESKKKEEIKSTQKESRKSRRQRRRRDRENKAANNEL